MPPFRGFFMTLNETLNRMSRIAEADLTDEQLANLKSANIPDDKSNSKQQTKDGPKFKTGNRAKRIYIADDKDGKNNGDGTFTGQSGSLKDREYISTNDFDNLMKQDKSDLIGAARQQLIVDGENGKEKVGVNYVGLKYDSKTNELSPSGDKVGVTDIATLNKVAKDGVPQKDGEVEINQKENLPATKGNDNQVTQQVQSDADKLEQIESKEVATSNFPISQQEAAELDKIQKSLMQTSSQLQLTETGDFNDVLEICNKFMSNQMILPQTKEAAKNQVSKIKTGNDNSFPHLFDTDGKQLKGSANPFSAIQGFGKFIGGLLGGIAKIAGMFVGGLASGQYGGKK